MAHGAGYHLLEQAQQRIGLEADAAAGPSLGDLRGQIRQPFGVAGDVEQHFPGLFVEIDGVALQAVVDDRVPPGSDPGIPLPQYFGVVHLAYVHVLAAGCHPDARDAAAGLHFGRLGGHQMKELLPRLGVGRGLYRHLTDEMFVQQGRQLSDRRIRTGGCAAIDQQPARLHGHRERAVSERTLDDIHQSIERSHDGGMAIGIERHGTRGRLAGAREIRQADGHLRRERLSSNGVRHQARGAAPILSDETPVCGCFSG